MDFCQDILFLISDFLLDEDLCRWNITSKTCQTHLKPVEAKRQTALSHRVRAQLLVALQVDEKDASALWDAMDADDAYIDGRLLLELLKPSVFSNVRGRLLFLPISFLTTKQISKSKLAVFFQNHSYFEKRSEARKEHNDEKCDEKCTMGCHQYYHPLQEVAKDFCKPTYNQLLANFSKQNIGEPELYNNVPVAIQHGWCTGGLFQRNNVRLYAYTSQLPLFNQILRPVLPLPVRFDAFFTEVQLQKVQKRHFFITRWTQQTIDGGSYRDIFLNGYRVTTQWKLDIVTRWELNTDIFFSCPYHIYFDNFVNPDGSLNGAAHVFIMPNEMRPRKYSGMNHWISLLEDPTTGENSSLLYLANHNIIRT
jgi:hypothetical protein